MVERDPRWEHVTAYMGPIREFSVDDFEEGFDAREWCEVEILVPYGGVRFHQRQRIHKNEFNDFFMEYGFMKWFLDELVVMLDEVMEKELKTT